MRLSPAFVDLFALLLAVLLLLPNMPDESSEDEDRAGDLVVETEWCGGCRTDVDLWVRSPGDQPVWFMRLRGKHFSLLRDDVGTSDHPPRWELAASREVPDGEYVVNLYLYSDAGGNAPVDVRVEVTLRLRGSNKETLWEGVRTLEHEDAEVTAVRFELEDRQLVPGSIRHEYEPLHRDIGGEP